MILILKCFANREKGTIGWANEENCELQRTVRDEKSGMAIFQTVRTFARKEKLALWLNEFLDSYKKMASNKNKGLVQNDFTYGHACDCFMPFLDFGVKTEIDKTTKVAGISACQERCGENDDCVGFRFDELFKRCNIYSELSESTTGSRFVLYGTKTCSANSLKSCTVFV